MKNVRDYAIISATYWVFTLTDGALRMLVLLYLHELGYAPLAIASLFVFYEFFGIVTNFVGGWLATKFGLKSTLFSGLCLQLIALCVLGVAADTLTVPIVMAAQALSGVAKDLTKMSAKSFIKFVVPADDPHGLMRWVAMLTGSKNTLKGVGFFLGGLLLGTVGFRGAVLGMAAGILVALLATVALLPRSTGRATGVRWRQLISDNERVNWLSAARLFLFGSRDAWFVVALPIFLQTVLGLTFAEVGGFLALWIIGYGIVQAAAPAFVGGAGRTPPDARRLRVWTTALVVPLVGILAGFHFGLSPSITLIVGLAVFGLVFAVDSAIHSYLIVSYAEGDRVALRVGFYYTANAVGRLVGTVLSGAVFQAAGQGMHGLAACIGASILLVLASSLLCAPLAAAERRAA